jgi:hypothetical protein
MDDQGFEFVAHDQDGYRLIRTVIPRTPTTHSLSVVVDRYFAMWETDLPIYIVNDATRLAALDPDVAEVLLAILKRNQIDPRFRASTWYTGDNPPLVAQLRDLHERAGRDPDSIVATEAEALAYIRSHLEAS